MLLIRVVYRVAEHVVDFGLVNVLVTSSPGLVGRTTAIMRALASSKLWKQLVTETATKPRSTMCLATLYYCPDWIAPCMVEASHSPYIR